MLQVCQQLVLHKVQKYVLLKRILTTIVLLIFYVPIFKTITDAVGWTIQCFKAHQQIL